MAFAGVLACHAMLTAVGAGAETGTAPELREVLEVISTNVPGLTQEELNRTAVRALIEKLGPKVSLGGARSDGGSGQAAVLKTEIYDGGMGYVRIGRLTSEVPTALGKWFADTNRTNKLKGIVLDVRYATGGDYGAAAALAALFARKDAPLLDWGQGLRKAEADSRAIDLPAAVLANSATSQAPEAFAALMRELGAALILGEKTSGAAMVYREVKLSNGDLLRVAAAPIRLGDGGTVPLDGVTPDIRVEVDPKLERAYYEDPFAWFPRTNALLAASNAQGSSTNRVARRARYGEAELVRDRSDVLGLDDELAERESAPEAPVVNDPALARALDLLKGLAVVRGAAR